MKITLNHTFEEIIAIENLLEAWSEFIKDKQNKQDVLAFKFHLVDNIFALHNDLKNHDYKHGGYVEFNICDPKPRKIHKAIVRDRLLHHAIYRQLYPFFDKTFIYNSYSCRKNKGTHKALEKFIEYGYKLSRNNFDTCWILKCDIKKFFANIDHEILMNILASYIKDENILWLLQKIIYSLETKPGAGLPLGNLTSQLFVNIYMNAFDQFVKHKIKAKYYIRYADDFVFFSKDKQWLEQILPQVKSFLLEKLKLELHPDKLFLNTLSSGVDFLGWVHFSTHRILRTTTKRRMFKKLNNNFSEQSVQSFLGMLSHGSAHRLREKIVKTVAKNKLQLQ